MIKTEFISYVQNIAQGKLELPMRDMPNVVPTKDENCFIVEIGPDDIWTALILRNGDNITTMFRKGCSIKHIEYVDSLRYKKNRDNMLKYTEMCHRKG